MQLLNLSLLLKSMTISSRSFLDQEIPVISLMIPDYHVECLLFEDARNLYILTLFKSSNFWRNRNRSRNLHRLSLQLERPLKKIISFVNRARRASMPRAGCSNVCRAPKGASPARTTHPASCPWIGWCARRYWSWSVASSPACQPSSFLHGNTDTWR